MTDPTVKLGLAGPLDDWNTLGDHYCSADCLIASINDMLRGWTRGQPNGQHCPHCHADLPTRQENQQDQWDAA